MRRLSKPNVPFVEALKIGGKQKPTLIVLQSSFTPTRSGAAVAIAQTMHRNDARESIHYVVDESTAVRCVDDETIAFHRDDVYRTLGIRLCDDPSGPQSRWDDRAHQGLLSNTAKLVAELCLIYKIPVRFLTESEVQKWRKWRVRRRGGLLTEGFLASTPWPQEYFLSLVQAHIEKLKLTND